MAEVKIANTPASEMVNSAGQTIAQAVQFRKMATIRKIDKLEPIEGADKIVKATVGGWQLVTAIDNGFKEGDLVVYCEIDSFIPTAIAPFLTKPGQYPKVFEGVEGERLRTVRLRGQISQGLLMPLTPEIRVAATLQDREEVFNGLEGVDVTAILGIQKYEAPVPACLAGEVRGMFPSFIPKTDQERIQNLKAELEVWQDQELTWEVTEKLDGSSMTVYMRDGDFGVCSRNLDLKRNEDNSLWKVALRQELDKVLERAGNFAIQGELIGEGIQGNAYKLRNQEFYVFDIFNIDTQEYLTPEDRAEFVGTYRLKNVPIFKRAKSLKGLSIADLLAAAEGKSVMGDINGPTQEGHVYKCNELKTSFKCISNLFLVKAKD